MTKLSSIPRVEKAGGYRQDLLASLVVFLVALPLCLGIAIASGLPPAAGIITGIVGGLVVGSLSGCPMQVSGPAAGLSVLVLELVSKKGLETLAVVLAIAGLIQLAAGMLRLGLWFLAIPPAVIHGMLAGIGVLIAASQFHVMFDGGPHGSGLSNLLAIPETIRTALGTGGATSHLSAAVVGVVTVIVLVLWGRTGPEAVRRIPAPLVAVAIATLLAHGCALPVKRVDIPDRLWDSLRWPAPSAFVGAFHLEVLLTALAFAVIASAETLLSAAAVDRLRAGASRSDYDRELVAQGIGNTLCGLIGALPMTGVIVRSKANVDAGARTRLSTILHSVWMLLLVVAVPGLLETIPIAALAAILVVTGVRLVDFHDLKQLHAHSTSEVAIYLITLVGVVSTDLLRGIGAGVLAACIRLLHEVTHLSSDLVLAPDGRTATLTLRGSASFLSLPRLARILDTVPAGTEVHVPLDQLRYIDHACFELLSTWRARHQATGGGVILELERLHGITRAARV